MSKLKLKTVNELRAISRSTKTAEKIVENLSQIRADNKEIKKKFDKTIDLFLKVLRT